MAHTLSWYSPEEILHLVLEGNLRDAELEAINDEVLAILNEKQAPIKLLIEATQLQTGYQTANNLRNTQRYKDHPLVDSIYVIADNKLNRLVTLLAFSASYAKFMQFNDLQTAERLVLRQNNPKNT